MGDGVLKDEAALRLLLEQLPAIVWSTDCDLRITSSAGSGLQKLGLRPGQVVGMTIPEYLGTDDEAKPSLMAHRRALEGRTVEYDSEWGGRAYRTHVEPLLDPEGKVVGTAAVALDVTRSKQDAAALKAAEEDLQQARMWETLGQTVGGIAHDFNNLLSEIIGYGDVATRGLSATDERRRDIDQMLGAAQRAAVLTHQLAALSRTQLLSPRILDLGALISGIESMLRRIVGPKVEMTVKTTPGLGRVSADRGHMEQAVIHLVINARDRMPGGGQLVIETSTAQHNGAGVADGLDARSFVVVSLKDSGPALDAPARQGVFDLFASAEADPAMSRMGLSRVCSMIKRSQGRISVESEPADGRGATFKILLPEVMGDAALSSPHTPPVTPEAPASETILLVDDEPGLRRLVCDALKAQGYHVLEAGSVQEALEIGETFPGPIDLLVADVVMPEMSGPQVAARLAPLRPEMRILYMSGHADEEIVHRGVLAAGQTLVAKPFTTVRLAHEVRRALRG